MNTRATHPGRQNPPRKNDRWLWMAGATAASAAAATSSKAAIVQISLINNRLDNITGDLLDSNFTGELVGDGSAHPGKFFSAINNDIRQTSSNGMGSFGVDCRLKISVNAGAKYVSVKAREAFTEALYYFATIGTYQSFGLTGPRSENQLVPIKFQDPKFNGGAVTDGLLDVHAFTVSRQDSAIAITRLVFDDASPTSALTGVVAGGTNTSIGSTEEGFFARTKNDFNDDGSSDLLWQNVSNGNLAVWFMNGTSILSEQSLGVESNTAWQLVGSGVFNTSGYNDLLWQNTSNGAVAVWFMNGTTYVSSRIIATQPNTNWKIVGAADFNGDGMPDLLWQNTSTGAIAVWFMNGTTYVSSQIIATQPNTAWKIVGTGDFNGDGNTDILWQNTSTGTVAVWFMNGTTVASSAILGTAPNSNWKIVGAGDFNGDGKPDILWQNTSTGAIAVWFMNGTTFVSGQIIATEANTSWQIRNR